MSRYDELIDKNRREKADQIADKTRQKLAGDERMVRYVDAFVRALPEFYQALVRNDVWNEYEHEQKSFLIPHREIIRCVQLKRWDARESWYATDRAAITDEGRYLLLEGAGKIVKRPNGRYTYTVDSYEELSVQRFAEHICDALCLDRKSRQFASFERENYPELHAALMGDDADETAFQYFAFCLPK